MHCDSGSPFLSVPNAEWLCANPLAFAIFDRFPVSPGHVLVISRRVVPTFFQCTPDEQARLLPEDDLELALDTGSAEAVQRLILHTPNGIARARMEYLYTRAPTRSRKLATDLHELYAGHCQICLWNPCEKYGSNLCQGHHIHWLSRGGADHLDNMVLVCPNHHAAIHKCDGAFDYADMAFIFPKYRGVLQINRHI